MLSKLTTFVVFSLCFVLCSLLICAPVYSGTIGVTISDPGIRCPETGANDAASICTHESTISLNGIVGLQVMRIGWAVDYTDFRGALPIRAEDLWVTTTQSATYAQLTGTVNIACDLSGKDIVINGVLIHGGPNESATLDNINMHRYDTGICATVDGSHHLVLTQNTLGSYAAVIVSCGAGMFGVASATAVGRDARATVKYSDGFNVTDAVWDKGSGCVLRDSLGNIMYLRTSIATAAPGSLGPQIHINYQDVPRIIWKNTSNGASGQCTGGNYWTADNIPLSKGDNTIVVTAEDNAGNSGYSVISVELYDLPVTITSPTPIRDYYTRTSSIDLSGTSELRDTPALVAVPVGADVVSASLPHCTLTEGEEISIVTTQSASYACLVGDIDISADLTGKSITINGVTVDGGANETETIDNILNCCGPLGIFPSLDRVGYHRLVLRSCICGSLGKIVITNDGGIFGSNTYAIGTDAIAKVTDSTGADISDASWDKGTGTLLRDSLGNTIQLQDVSAMMPPSYLGVQFSMQPSPSAVLKWRNDTTGAEGICSGIKNWSAADIPLVEGQNRVIITGSDESGILGKAEIDPIYFVPCSSLNAAMKDGHSFISLTDQIVTLGSSDDNNYFYIEDMNRTSGIAVLDATAERGVKMTVDGFLYIDSYINEPGLQPYRIEKEGSGDVHPLGVASKVLITPEDNLRLTGLLVRTWGKVKPTTVLPNSFAIQDGSGTELICQLPDSMTVNPAWKFVGVTGIASRLSSSQRVIRVRDADDIVTY